MTTLEFGTLSGAARELHARVRGTLEAEYLRLRTVDRTTLLEQIGAAAGDERLDLDVIEAELEVLDRRIARIHDHLATIDDQPWDDGVVVGRAVLVDLGAGPRPMVVSRIPVADPQVIAADSPLGRALLGAHPGDTIEYLTPGGRAQARVFELECREPASTREP